MRPNRPSCIPYSCGPLRISFTDPYRLLVLPARFGALLRNDLSQCAPQDFRKGQSLVAGSFFRPRWVCIAKRLSMCLVLGLSQQNPMQGIHGQQVCKQETYDQSHDCANVQKFRLSVLWRKYIDGGHLLYNEDGAPHHKVEADCPEPRRRILWPMQKPQVAWKLCLNRMSRQA